MKRLGTLGLVLGCLAALTLACYHSAIFKGEQFAYRDAAHFYYPLYERVQIGWKTGHYPPLWETEENAGMPLLGNPTAAVLYPGKLLFALVPYPVGVRLYTIGHTWLAFGAMLALMRSWKTSWAGATIAGLSYAFAAPILFQYCNIIFLVGAAWAPLGLRGVDRWLRLGRGWAILELAVVLAMETMGGDPETAYLTGVCAGLYALILAWDRRALSQRVRTWSGRLLVPAALVVSVGWIVVTLVLAYHAIRLRPPNLPNNPSNPLPWMPYSSFVVLAAWGLVAMLLIWQWKRGKGLGALLVPALAGLLGAASLAIMFSAVQLFPVTEFTGQTSRAASGGPHDIYPFSLPPNRLIEFVWPNFFGTSFHGNRYWFDMITPGKIWVPSLYSGGLTIVLAIGALRFGEGRPERRWLSILMVGSLISSFGEYASPIYVARFSEIAKEAIGKHDKSEEATIRFDGQLRDGDGSPYWFLAQVLPGFRQFRFPSKLLTFTILALAALAGIGWDAMMAGDPTQRRRSTLWASGWLVTTVIIGVISLATRPACLAWLDKHKRASMFGPFDVSGAFLEAQCGLVRGGIMLGLGLWIARRGSTRPRLAVGLALVALTADLAIANASSVLTVPQHLFETPPKIAKLIQEAEAKDPEPSGNPYRIHRMPSWSPQGLTEGHSSEPMRDVMIWEHETIQPKTGINFGIQYTMTLGVAELYDYEWFFAGYTKPALDEIATTFGVPPGTRIVAFPRRGFDMWNSRYFVLPSFPNKWTDEHRGFASFLENTKRIYPAPNDFAGPDRKEKELDRMKNEDVQILRNFTSYPRAWVVHSGRVLKAINGLGRAQRLEPMYEILYSKDLLWQDPNRVAYDARQSAWFEESEIGEVRKSLSGRPSTPEEAPKITRYDAERVEIDVSLETPGVVVLADIYYPGWVLTIDGASVPVYRVNRMMRGAAVQAGMHHLVFTYRPLSYRLGLIVTCAGIMLGICLGVWYTIRPVSPLFTPSTRETKS